MDLVDLATILYHSYNGAGYSGGGGGWMTISANPEQLAAAADILTALF